MSPPCGGIGVGIIGAGFMGRTHAAAYLSARAAGLPLTLLAATGNRASPIPGDPPHVPDARALLALDTIDAVSICTYTDSHVELALAALAAGKHVLLEKPVALKHGEVRRLAAAARASGRVCMPAMCMRFWPGWPWLREQVLAGSFGAVHTAEFTRLSARPAWSTEFYGDYERSGGALFDLHIHDVDFLRWCFGDPSLVTSRGNRDDVRTVYRISDGPSEVSARGAWLDDPATPFVMRYVVRFEEAEARFDLDAASPVRVHRGGTSEAVTLPAATGYEGEVRHFVELVLGRVARPVATLDEAVAVTAILEAEERSLESAGSVAPLPHPR